MIPQAIIVRLGELTLKGRNRRRFEKKILQQITMLMKPYARASKHEEFGRVYIILNGEPYQEIAAGLDRIFGLFSYSPAWIAKQDLADIRNKALECIRSCEPFPKTFKVSAKRANKSFPHTALELGHLIGGYILHNEDGRLSVDVHHPDVELKIDIRMEDVYVFSASVAGTGGYPLGTNGKAMLLLSGGIDSPVAGWLSMRRGLEIEGVHFHSFPFTSEKAQQKVIDLTRKLALYSSERIVLHMVPFTEIQTKLNQAGQDNLIITLMRRSMLRITERIANERKAGAIVTGDSLGQVASQTLSSLQVIGRETTLPLLRPLIMMDKVDIIKLAEKIETMEISILPYEDCCTLFIPKSPATNPNLSIVERLEKMMDWLPALEEEAVAKTERLFIHREEEDKFDEYF
ncbi:MAG: tRNA 4-thiouridine(8) synthase ThiI [Gorillibacterium sp.]|nr:tRNA 4-thiouridine(8) synthase ThiI [Gorillibacterium sp.]